MRNFKFRLERVLDWYGNQFQIEQAHLATTMAARQAVQQNIARLNAERLGVERDMIGRRDISGRDFAALGLYRLRARKLEHEFNLELQNREKAVREQMQRVLEAQRKVRLIEKLRERRLTEHRYLEDKELEAVAAEAFLAKWERTPTVSAATLAQRDPSQP